MKKVFILSILSAFSFLSAQAQFNPGNNSSTDEPTFSLAPKAGLTISKYKIGYADPEDDKFFVTKNQIGFTVGLAADIPFGGSKFGIQPEILYSQRGSVISQDYANLLLYGYAAKNVSIKEVISYIEIPILFKYKMGGEESGLYLAAGPSLNFGIAATSSESGTLTDAAVSPPYIIILKQSPNLGLGTRAADTYKAFDASLIFGLGGYFKVGNGKFFVDVRYALGLNNIINKNFDENSLKFVSGKEELRLTSFFASEVRNRSIQLSVGYFFPLGGGVHW